ncbi:MAG: VanZ family protein [Lachnospiraceae bacterium]|nr:VanZ family protein [Lachnospiraceae bacterium]
MMKNSRKIFLILTLAVMIFIFVQSAMPADLSGAESGPLARLLAGLFGAADDPAALDLADLIVRKIAHFLEYLALGLCLRMAFGGRAADRPRLNAAFPAWLIGAAYAVTDEIHQIFVPGRSGQVKDVLLDAAGVLAGVLIAAAILKRAGAAGARSRH